MPGSSLDSSVQLLWSVGQPPRDAHTAPPTRTVLGCLAEGSKWQMEMRLTLGEGNNPGSPGEPSGVAGPKGEGGERKVRVIAKHRAP